MGSIHLPKTTVELSKSFLRKLSQKQWSPDIWTPF